MKTNAATRVPRSRRSSCAASATPAPASAPAATLYSAPLKSASSNPPLSAPIQASNTPRGRPSVTPLETLPLPTASATTTSSAVMPKRRSGSSIGNPRPRGPAPGRESAVALEGVANHPRASPTVSTSRNPIVVAITTGSSTSRRVCRLQRSARPRMPTIEPMIESR